MYGGPLGVGQISDKNVVSEVSEEENEYIYVKEHKRQGIATTKDVTFAKIAEEKKENRKLPQAKPAPQPRILFCSSRTSPWSCPSPRPALPSGPAPPVLPLLFRWLRPSPPD